MGTKSGLSLGLGAEYVSDTRAGREQYERVRPVASKIRRLLVVARPLNSAGEKVSNMVHAQSERVTDKVADTVKECLFGASATLREVSLRFEDKGPDSR